MSALLITGGAGFIGSNFVRFWRRRRPSEAIVVLDALTYAGNRANIADMEDIHFVHGDIRDADLVRSVLHDHAIDTLVHFAAETHVDVSIAAPRHFADVNIMGTQALLHAAKAEWLDRAGGRPHRFHHISTDEVYGALAESDPAFTESSPYSPNSPYAASKAAADHLVRAYQNTYGLQASVSHCSNNFGPYQFPEKLIPRLLVCALTGQAMPLYGSGRQIRDWLHVEDHCSGIALILEQGGACERYNIGGGIERQNKAIAELICTAVDSAFAADPALAVRFPDAPPARGRPCASLITHVDDRPGHDFRYALNHDKAADELGYRPTATFDGVFQATIDWYIANEHWWREAQTRQPTP